jgi:hypothetical protein
MRGLNKLYKSFMVLNLSLLQRACPELVEGEIERDFELLNPPYSLFIKGGDCSFIGF